MNMKDSQSAKTTLEVTTAVLCTNIEFIKKDIIDIKITLQSIMNIQENKINSLENKLDKLSIIVYTGVGISLAVSVLLKLFIN